jgi:hypothetical protein
MMIYNDESESTTNINAQEPEFPLTGYNYRRYFNEGSTIYNATMSAHKLNQMMKNMDNDIFTLKNEIKRFKYDVLINNKKKNSLK